MVNKVNYSDLSAQNYETTIRVGTSKTTLLFGDYGSCYGEYDEPIAINNSTNPVSTVDSNSNLMSNYFNTHKTITNGIVLAGKKFTADTPAGYIKFTSHGKTMIINVTIIGEAVEKNIKFNDSLNNNYTVRVEDISNCSLKLYYIYYEGKDSNGNWKPVTPTSNVLKTISLTFEKIGPVSYKDDNYTNQYIYWDHIPQQYINKLPVNATATISIEDETGTTISDTRTITFIDAIKKNVEFNDNINNYIIYIENSTNYSLKLYYIYYAGKNSDGDWNESTLTSKVLTDITLKFGDDNISYTKDDYSNKCIYWDIPENYINNLPTTATATISITDEDGSTISDTQVITFKNVINVEFDDSRNKYIVYVEDINNCSLKLYYIYYEGKDSNGNWKKVTPTNNVLTDITLKFDKNNVSYNNDNYSYQYVYWNNIPENYINNLPTTATATISIKNEIGEIISDTQTIIFKNAINVEFDDSKNNYIVYVEDINNCSLKLYYIYYEGKDSNGNWKKVTPTNNVLTDITLKFDKNNVSYNNDNYSYQYVYWNNIPENYINNLPTTATATISIKNEIGEIISDTQTITFIDAIKRNIEFNDSLNNYKVYVEYTNNCSLNLYYIYYEGKDSDGNWNKVTPTNNVLTAINLNFGDDNVLYTEDNYSEQCIYWDNIPQDYINILPTNAIVTISITDYDESTISDKRTIQFISKYVINIKESVYTTCPNSTISISFEIKDNYENYCDVNNISSFSVTLDNTNFTKSDCKFNSNKNIIEVTTSGTNGDTAKLTLKIGDIINEIITITNEITYSCGGIEEV